MPRSQPRPRQLWQLVILIENEPAVTKDFKRVTVDMKTLTQQVEDYTLAPVTWCEEGLGKFTSRRGNGQVMLLPKFAPKRAYAYRDLPYLPI